MRLRLSLGQLILFELALFESEGVDPDPDGFHDLSADHPIGFTAPVGWLPDRLGGDDGQEERSRRGVSRRRPAR